MSSSSRTAYHRLLRERPDHQGWQGPVAAIAGVTAYVALTTVAVVMLAVAAGVTDRMDRFDAVLEAAELTTDDVWMLGIMLLLVAFMLPAIQLGRAAVLLPHGDLWSVEGRLRWRWLAVCCVLAFLVFGVAIGAAVAMDDPVRVRWDGEVVVGLLVVLAAVPLQATAEEVVFRGHLMQTVASWTRWTVVPVVVTTLLFVAGHAYDVWGLVDVGIFGVVAAVLAIRTGGLEAPIAAHVANNVVLLVAELTTTTEVTSGELGPQDLWLTAATGAVMIGACELLMRLTGTARTRERLPDPPRRPQPMFIPTRYQPRVTASR